MAELQPTATLQETLRGVTVLFNDSTNRLHYPDAETARASLRAAGWQPAPDNPYEMKWPVYVPPMANAATVEPFVARGKRTWPDQPKPAPQTDEEYLAEIRRRFNLNSF